MPDPSAPLPPGLRALQRLVMALMVVMILGFLVLIGALVMRLNATSPPLPDQLDLPEGVTATAFTQGDGWFAVVTQDGRILIYDRLTSRLKQTIELQ
ncbi:hypothetical protein FHG66_15435 [Rubellimicrobium rubrum]|uniref:Uncharacterized protein n=1 Tax=Rubellimicrobium rubrum TaxID=2585369 RepID=A0A5C4MSX1_9RHOB|nr:hypothetical protein FHG66_15435 [Rubellimicrobium rubrum]